MGIATKTIVLEDVLERMFADLPEMVSLRGTSTHPIVFHYGDKKALNVFLKRKKSEDTYPLIWLLYPNVEDHDNTSLEADNVSLVLAVSTNSVMQNKERMATTFGKILMPLFFNVRTLFKRANIVNIDGKYRIIKYPNYSDTDEGTEHGGAFIWDAIKITFSMKLIDTCYRTVTF